MGVRPFSWLGFHVLTLIHFTVLQSQLSTENKVDKRYQRITEIPVATTSLPAQILSSKMCLLEVQGIKNKETKLFSAVYYM